LLLLVAAVLAAVMVAVEVEVLEDIELLLVALLYLYL
jgi:hypothetical protein